MRKHLFAVILLAAGCTNATDASIPETAPPTSTERTDDPIDLDGPDPVMPLAAKTRPDDVVDRAPGGHTCARATAPRAFDDITACAGIDVTRDFVGDYYTTGQAFADYDQDGWLDLYVTDSRGPNTLYRNRGDGTFEVSDVSDQVADAPDYSGGAVFADYDNDGDPDLYVLALGRNTLYENTGDGFVDVTERAGVGDVSKGETAAFGDYDNDGLLDLYVTNWLCVEPQCGDDVLAASVDRLYHNEGDGTFTDVSSLLGEYTRTGAGFVASFLDFDDDGDLDIYLVNDKGYDGPPHPGAPINRNMLWRNDGPGCLGWCFREIGREVGADARLEGMGLAIADYDDDGDLDMFFTNTGQPMLLRNEGGTFVEMTDEAEIFDNHTSWGTVFVDYDNDGDDDLYYAAGRVFGFKNQNRLFSNDGDGTFTNVSEESGADVPNYSIGVASGDYDNDGAVDLVVGNWARGYRLLRNMTNDREQNRWLSVRLEGGGPVNRDAVGSRVYVHTTGGRVTMQELKCGSSHGAGNELALHFGLGLDAVDFVEVRWPDGTKTEVRDVDVRSRITIAYPGE